jgi:5-oxoprolinase (ATP-hydrolysing)
LAHNTVFFIIGHVSYKIMKLLSVNPGSYPDAPREAIRRLLEEFTGEPYPADEPIRSGRIESVRMGTTVATNALLERQGEPCVLVTTAGQEDLLTIGNQSRPAIFDLKVQRAAPIVEATIPALERVVVDSQSLAIPVHEGGAAMSDADAAAAAAAADGSWPVTFLGAPARAATGTTGERVVILAPLDLEHLRASLAPFRARGVTSVAVALAHSYTFPAHEQAVGALARDMGFTHVSLSSDVMPAVKLVPRAFTAAADAYLTPCVKQYLSQFLAGFDAAFAGSGSLLFMQSDGGLTSVRAFSGVRAVLSGPAGGVVGFSKTSFLGAPVDDDDNDDDDEHAAAAGVGAGHAESAKADAETAGPRSKRARPASSSAGDASSPTKPVAAAKAQPSFVSSTRRPVIGFDMGGTSTDVSRYAGRLDHIFENCTAGVTIQAPQLDINTVAAGGGSILTFTAGMFNVGPESASANPGPACYRRGGPLAVTDANLLVGRINPAHFPRVFGPKQDLPLDATATQRRFDEMTTAVNAYLRSKGSNGTSIRFPPSCSTSFPGSLSSDTSCPFCLSLLSL